MKRCEIGEYPTWFIMPDGLDDVVRREIEFLQKTESGVSCNIFRPDHYEEGAWRVEIELTSPLADRVPSLAFSLPELPHRMCHPEREYVRVIGGKLQGCFVDRHWFGDVYSNGIAESENPTDIDTVKKVILDNIMKALREGQ